MQRIVMHRSAIVHGLLRSTTHVRDFRETVQTSTSKLRTKQPIVRPTRVASRSRRRRIDFAARASVARTRVDNAAALHRRHPAPRVESTIASLHGLRDHSRPAPAAADEDISATCGNTPHWCSVDTTVNTRIRSYSDIELKLVHATGQ